MFKPTLVNYNDALAAEYVLNSILQKGYETVFKAVCLNIKA